MEYGEDIFNHFLLWTKVCFIKNHDFAPVLFAEPLKQVKSESCQSVFVSDDKVADSSRHDSSQYGKQLFPFKVESATNFSDDFCFWVFREERFDLTFEVWFLRSATDSTIDDVNPFGNKLSYITLDVVSSLS